MTNGKFEQRCVCKNLNIKYFPRKRKVYCCMSRYSGVDNIIEHDDDAMDDIEEGFSDSDHTINSTLERVLCDQSLSSERTVKMFLDNELSKTKVMADSMIQISKMFSDIVSRQKHLEGILRKDIDVLFDKISRMEKHRKEDLIFKNKAKKAKMGFGVSGSKQDKDQGDSEKS